MEQKENSGNRLVAIMATDVVGYSSLMQADEAVALAALGIIRTATENQVKIHRGRIANTAGDSVLAEFGSAVNAVSCARALQEELSSRPPDGDLQVRIGIHIGDVIDKNGDLFGTAVNIAARLEAIAPPGGIVISAAVRDAIVGKLSASIADLGLKTLKNIGQPLRAYALSVVGKPSPYIRSLPDRPSIAVLPFENMSSDADQEYFSDGIVEEIITALSRMRWLFVIARNSSFIYKGRAIEVKQIGRELGVRYVLDGSVRKAGNKIRITGKLIDAATGAHIWADRFEGRAGDIFDLQDQVTASVVGAIAPRLEQAEIERIKQKPTDSLDGYDYYLRGLASFHLWSREATLEALSLFSRAIELDPNFAAAYGMAARCYAQIRVGGWGTDRVQEDAETVRLARRAVELGKDDAVALCFGGWALARVAGDLESGTAFIDRALVLNPNLAAAWCCSGWVRISTGKPKDALEHFARALRLSPFDPLLGQIQTGMATAHFLTGQYDEACSWAEQALRERPTYLAALRASAASNAVAGRLTEAQAVMQRILRLDSDLRIKNLGERLVLQPEHSDKWADALRQAGLPEE